MPKIITILQVGLLAGLLVALAPARYALANEHGGGEAKKEDKKEEKPHGGGEGGEGKPADAKPKPPKPKPKKIDKDKNCGWEREIDLDLDGKHIAIPQASLKNVMKGAESVQDGYDIQADPERLMLRVKTPDGVWFIASMTRLGNPDEGCIFYFVGEPRQVETEPPLF